MVVWLFAPAIFSKYGMHAGTQTSPKITRRRCGCCDGWRTDVLFTPLAVEDGHRSQRAPGAEGALASVVHADAVGSVIHRSPRL